MLAGSLSALQRMMDQLTMVSVNYNMKINTKKTKVLRISKGSESAMKIAFAGKIIEQVKEFCYLGNMISDDATEKSREGQQQRRQSGLKSEGSWIRVKKFRFLQANFRKISIFSGNFTKEYRVFQANFRNFLFFQAIKKIDFPSKKMSIYSYSSGHIIIFLFKSNHFRTYFLYTTPTTHLRPSLRPPHDPPAQNMGSRPSAARIDASE